ncbi:MAG: glycine cleavage system protein GcvH [Bacteroidales bacterium]|jgi:glycine cleavage system H protein|nr:glycine cleavage system protein GcvH [Bacteroidales bacterium]MBR6847694.1 glycine cleavage system protein GcvH [Bacteroidales bacterium]
MNIPSNLKYTQDDEWIRLEGEFGYIGITDYAQHELGDITFVDIDPDLVGETLDAEEEFGAVEAVKTTAELTMPVAGEVVEVNETLADEENAKLVNTDPYGEGWMLKIKVSNVADVNNLLDAAAYEAKIK